MFTDKQVQSLASIMNKFKGMDPKDLIHRLSNLKKEEIEAIMKILNNKSNDGSATAQMQDAQIVNIVTGENNTPAPSATGSKYYNLADAYDNNPKTTDGYVKIGKYEFMYGDGTENNYVQDSGDILVKVTDNHTIRAFDSGDGVKLEGIREPKDIAMSFIKLFSGFGYKENINSLSDCIFKSNEDMVKDREKLEFDSNKTPCSADVFKTMKFIEQKYGRTWNKFVCDFLNNPTFGFTKIPKCFATLKFEDTYSPDVVDFATFKNMVYTQGLVRDAK